MKREVFLPYSYKYLIRLKEKHYKDGIEASEGPTVKGELTVSRRKGYLLS